MLDVLLIGFGAMGRTVLHQLGQDAAMRISHVLVPSEQREALQREMGASVRVIECVDELANKPDFAIECAGHGALHGVVLTLLRLGVDTIVASVGALSEPGLPEMLEQAAAAGNARLSLVSGAIPGIDALSAAANAPLDEVSYIGRKPPLSWLGTPAEERFDLASLTQEAIIFEGNARDAARLFPKNANVAAIVALAGIGFERTRVRLIADPQARRNIHQLCARGEFGELDVRVAACALADNPKTSALAAWSIIEAARRRVRLITI